jgi:hypothetical protein
MHTKQNTSKYGNIAQLGSPVVNFCVRHTEDAFQAHEHSSPKKSVLIPRLTLGVALWLTLPWKHRAHPTSGMEH